MRNDQGGAQRDDHEVVTQRPQLSLKPWLALVCYVALAVVWAANHQPIEDAFGWNYWFLSLPVATITFGWAVGRWWAVTLAVIPALVTVGWWDAGCSSEDVCFGSVVFLVLVPLCALSIGLGILLRRSWSEVLRGVRRATRRAGSTIEARHQDRD